MGFNHNLMLSKPIKVKSCISLYEDILRSLKEVPDNHKVQLVLSETTAKDIFEVGIVCEPDEEVE